MLANKIFDSKKEPFGTKNSFKQFIGYNNNYVIRTLCVILQAMPENLMRIPPCILE